MGEPTPVDPMSDDCVNVECILRPIKGVEGGSSKSPVGFLRPRLGRRQQARDARLVVPRLVSTGCRGQDAGDCKKLADAGGGSLNEVPRVGSSSRSQD